MPKPNWNSLKIAQYGRAGYVWQESSGMTFCTGEDGHGLFVLKKFNEEAGPQPDHMVEILQPGEFSLIGVDPWRKIKGVTHIVERRLEAMGPAKSESFRWTEVRPD